MPSNYFRFVGIFHKMKYALDMREARVILGRAYDNEYHRLRFSRTYH